MQGHITRRELLAGLGAARLARAVSAPTAPVAVARCKTYGSELLPALERMFDQLGGLGRLVKNKTVAIKLNLTGSPRYRMGYRPAELAQWTHPAVIAATVHLMGRAGALPKQFFIASVIPAVACSFSLASEQNTSQSSNEWFRSNPL